MSDLLSLVKSSARCLAPIVTAGAIVGWSLNLLATTIDGVPVRLLQEGANYTVYVSQNSSQTSSGYDYLIFISQNGTSQHSFKATVSATCKSHMVYFYVHKGVNSNQGVSIDMSKPKTMQNSIRIVSILYNFVDPFKRDWLSRGQKYC
jgi:hypothetical protein